MSERQQPGLSTESPKAYRRSAGGRRSDKPAGSATRMIGLNLVMALLLAGLVLAGWFIANQQQMLSEERARVDDANQRLEKLENRLVATDSMLSQEGQDTQEKIGFWESEIRKLWAVSNERNKGWIEDNKNNIAKVQKTLNGIEASNRDMKAAVGRHESAFQTQQTLIDQLASLELQMQQIVRGQRDLVDKVNAASQEVASVRAGLSNRVEDHSEAIQSMDAFRVAINSRLSDIERRLNAVVAAGG